MSIYENLEQTKLVACRQGMEHNRNYNIIIMNHVDGKFGNGSTYETVADSYFNKERPNAVLLFRTDDLLASERIRGAEKWWAAVVPAMLGDYMDCGELNCTRLAEDAAEHFRCKTDNGESEAEQQLYDMAVDWAQKNEDFYAIGASIQSRRPI
jgi:hypothetical protein